MQASSVLFNTKPLLAPIYVGNLYGKDNRNFTSNTIQLNRAQLKQPVTWRHMSRRRCSRAYLVNSKVGLHVRRLHVSCAVVGPNEPHAASTCLDVVTEKQSLDRLDPEVERREYEQFLRLEIPSHPKLQRGQLKNGLRYLILPNKVPPNRYYSSSVTANPFDNHSDDEYRIRV